MHQIRDDMYVNGEIVRRDYTLGTLEGGAVLDELKTEFPEYGPFGRSRFNLIGRFDGYRLPYTNPSISWYDYDAYPSEALQLAFGTSYQQSKLKNWYGLKFDLVTKKAQLKVVVNEYDGGIPELPVDSAFFAITHAQDGTSSDYIDAYVQASPKRIREFCADNSLSYPLPPATHTECDVVWCWGFVFNKQTMEYGAVKAYARYSLTVDSTKAIHHISAAEMRENGGYG